MNRCPVCGCWLEFVGIARDLRGRRRWDRCTNAPCGQLTAATLDGFTELVTKAEPPSYVFRSGGLDD